MGNDTIQRELAELRAQLEALKAARDTEAAPTPTEAAEGEEPEEELTAEAGRSTGGEPETSDLTTQFQELIDSLDKNLQDTNPTTLLAVFALGVLVGRLLPR